MTPVLRHHLRWLLIAILALGSTLASALEAAAAIEMAQRHAQDEAPAPPCHGDASPAADAEPLPPCCDGGSCVCVAAFGTLAPMPASGGVLLAPPAMPPEALPAMSPGRTARPPLRPPNARV